MNTNVMMDTDKGRLAEADIKTGGEVALRCICCGEVQPHRLEPLALPPADQFYSNHHIAACNVCGLRSSHPMPDREELRRWYHDGRAVPPAQRNAGLLRSVWRRQHDSTLLRAVARRANPVGGLLVDVGAGEGRLSRAVRRSGLWQVVATELAEHAVELLRQDGFDARFGNLDEVGIVEGSVDVVLASHLVEHVPDVESFLASVHRLLRPGGLFVALVPSEESWRARLGSSTWHHVNPPGHLWGFRPDTFSRVLARNGFEPLMLREVHVVCEIAVIARRSGQG